MMHAAGRISFPTVHAGPILAFVLAAAGVLGGCATTDLTSFTDPAYRTGAGFQSVMVLGDQMGLEERQLAETAMVDAFANHGVRALRSIDYAPPTRGNAADQIALALERTGVDALLVLSLADQSVNETYVPPTYHPGTTYGTMNTYGGSGTYTQYTTPGYTTGGYTIDKPRASYAVTLFDTRTFNVAWQADGQSRGNAFAEFRDLTINASQETVQVLIQDGLFGPVQDTSSNWPFN